MEQIGIVKAEVSKKASNGKVAFICGIIAVSLNLLAVTAVIGFILGVLSIVYGLKSYKYTAYGKSGLVLGSLSLFVIMTYVLSTVIVFIVDPFL